MEEFGDDWDMPVCELILLSSSIITQRPGSQNDMLMWLMSEAKGAERSLKGLARRLLIVNFAAIHSSAQASDNSFLPTTES